MHFFIHNSFHAGDILLTRPIILAIKEHYPDVRLTLECPSSRAYLWEDLGLPINIFTGDSHMTTVPTSNCPPDAIFLNMWFGVFEDILSEYHLTYDNNIHTFHRQILQKNLHHIYQLPLPPFPPALRFFKKNEISVMIMDGSNSVLIENGQVFSNQSIFPLNQYLTKITKAFPKLTFYCSANPGCNNPYLIDCSHLNLLELSELSNHCKAFLTLCSGVNAATYTEINRFKPRCFAGLQFPLRVWEDSRNPVFQAKNIHDIYNFLETINLN